MSKILVNEVGTQSGTDVAISSGNKISGTASQFKMTDLVAGDVVYASSADTLGRLAKGAAGQALLMNTGATAPEWGTAGGDNTPAFEATQGAEQSGLTSNVITKMAYNTEVFDIGGNYDHTSNYRFVAPEAAKYFFYSQCRFVADDGVGKLNEGIMKFYLNGSDSGYKVYYGYRDGSNQGSQSETLTNCAIMVLAESDYVEVYADIGTGSGTWTIQNNNSAFFGYKMIGI